MKNNVKPEATQFYYWIVVPKVPIPVPPQNIETEGGVDIETEAGVNLETES